MTTMPRIKYTGTALPTGATTVSIFNSYTAGMGGAIAMYGIRRILFEVNNDQTGTLKEYKSVDGSTWVQISNTSVAAAAANSTNVYDYLVEPYIYWKLEWLNGGSNQTKFDANIAASDQRTIAT